jgi:tetratricopeptide (TPR) repeat protein
MRPIDTDALFAEAFEHHRRGRHTDALRLYDLVIQHDPKAATAHCNKGIELQALQRVGEALQSYDSALQVEPDNARAHYLKGTALRQLRREEEALESLNRAIGLRPDYAEAYNDRGRVLHSLKQTVKALESYSRAIELEPNFIDAYMNMADMMQDSGRLDLALEICDRATDVEPKFAEAHNKRGDALRRLTRLDEALQSYGHAIALKPEFADAYNGRAVALQELKCCDEALESYDTAIALKPDYADAYFNKSTCTLLAGNFEDGWSLYEWRKRRAKPTGLRNHSEPDWSGAESLAGKTLVICAEQGLGDTLQFCRYALLARKKGAKVVLAVQDQVMRLLKGLGADIEIIPQKGTPDAFDYHVALMSMPLAFQTTLSSCPAKVPYLHAEPERVTKWRERIGGEGFKIGICWQATKIDRFRSFPLDQLQGLAMLPNVRLISLQKNDGVEQLGELPSGMRVETLGQDLDAGPDAFVDTAAVMECLDLVITPDTAIAHLAGALARPTWVALKYVPDWRWLLDRADCPWYPTMKLFRQPSPGDWPSVFADIEAELAAQLKGAG